MVERNDATAEDDDQMDETASVYFPETEEAYEAWIGRHSHGYVINALKSKGQDMYWHRADCPHLGPADGWRYVGDDLMKACALDPGELAAWAKQRPEKLHCCKDCRSKLAKEHGVTA